MCRQWNPSRMIFFFFFSFLIQLLRIHSRLSAGPRKSFPCLSSWWGACWKCLERGRQKLEEKKNVRGNTLGLLASAIRSGTRAVAHLPTPRLAVVCRSIRLESFQKPVSCKVEARCPSRNALRAVRCFNFHLKNIQKKEKKHLLLVKLPLAKAASLLISLAALQPSAGFSLCLLLGLWEAASAFWASLVSPTRTGKQSGYRMQCDLGTDNENAVHESSQVGKTDVGCELSLRSSMLFQRRLNVVSVPSSI